MKNNWGKNGIFIALFIVLISFLIFVINYNQVSSKEVSNYIKYAPEMKDVLTKKQVSLKDYEDKVLVLEFFETWCPACVSAIPELNKFYSIIQSDKDLNEKVKFFSILSSSSGDENYITEFIKSKGIKYPVLLEVKPQLSYNLGVRYIPTLFVIKDGKIVYSKVGPEKAEKLIENLRKVL